MKKSLLLCISFLFVFGVSVSKAQPTEAYDFVLPDCDGMEHHLFEKLDNGEVVVLAFIMGCPPCVRGCKMLDTLYNEFEISHPGKLHILTMGDQKSMKCSTVKSWMNSNNLEGIAFAGDSATIARYKGTGMPTIVILGGKDHKIFFWKQGYPQADSINYLKYVERAEAMRSAINTALTTASVPSHYSKKSVTVLPNPAGVRATVAIVSEKEQDATIMLYNAVGVKVQTIYSGRLEKGTTELAVVTDKLTNGTYYIHVTRNGMTEVVSLTVTH